MSSVETKVENELFLASLEAQEKEAWDDFVESQGGLEAMEAEEKERTKAENQKDETWYVCLYTYKSASIEGPKEKDVYGWHYGNYGCGEDFQVAVDCLIVDEKGRDMYQNIDNRLPAILFVNRKEKDQVVIPVDKRKITLVLFQTNQALGGGEPFEEVFRTIVTEKQSMGRPGSYTPELSYEEQKRIFKEFTDKHFPQKE